MNDTELYHYGVKGMKWGIRRARKKLSKGDRVGGIARLKSEREKASNALMKTKRRGVKLEGKNARLKKQISRRTFTEFGRKSTIRKIKKSAGIDSKLYKNHKRQVVFEKGISEIDKTLIRAGEEFVKKKVK